MRISLSGASNVGKSTLLNAFFKRWSNYDTPKKTYRDIIEEEGLTHSAQTTEITQLKILQWMLDEQDKYTKDSKVIYDRCPWDCLAYTLQANESNIISDEVTAAVIDIVKASLKNLDIIFWIKHDPDIKIINNGTREIDKKFIEKTDQIFSDLYQQYADHLEDSPFYIKEDCPAIIPVEGKTVDDRIAWIGEFLNNKGDLIVTESSILAPENVDLMEQMLKEQGDWVEKDNQFKNLSEQIKNFKI
jgi:predicted ATPase